MCMSPPLPFYHLIGVECGVGGCILRRRGIDLLMDRGIWIRLRYDFMWLDVSDR